jgi:hypothetical protein
VNLRLELYTPEELAKIVTRSATILGMPIDPEGAMEIASRSRGTPRIANRFLRRVRDFAEIIGDIDGEFSLHIVRECEAGEFDGVGEEGEAAVAAEFEGGRDAAAQHEFGFEELGFELIAEGAGAAEGVAVDSEDGRVELAAEDAAGLGEFLQGYGEIHLHGDYLTC